jgi:2'-5' RNA ligase
MGVFLGIELPDSVRSELARVSLDSLVSPLHPQAIEQYHVTLIHFGTVSDAEMRRLVESVSHVTRDHCAFRLGIGDPGHFQDGRYVWWGVIGQMDALRGLWTGLMDSTATIGTSIRVQPGDVVPQFRPHITVASADDSALEPADTMVAKLRNCPRPSFSVTELTLFSAQSGQYTALERFALSGGP